MPWRAFTSLLFPQKDWIQVEVTTHCNASCVYCPRTAYQDRWVSRFMPLTTFHKLLPYFPRTRLVYLQGWGEPLLHPDFFAMVTLAKQAGCRVGATTNGMLLDDGKIIRMVESGMDVAAFSLAGTDEKNDAIRRGTRLATVLEAVHRLHRGKEKTGQTQPEIHLAYLLLRSGLADLPRLPQLLKGSGVTQVVISTLDFVASRELAAETLIPADHQEYQELEAQLAEVAATGQHYGLRIHYRLPRPGKRLLICTENIGRALVVAADGGVSPCVFTNLPVSGVTCYPRGVARPYQPVTFGNLHDRPLAAIWRGKAYARFRRSFYTDHLAAPCRDCPKL